MLTKKENLKKEVKSSKNDKPASPSNSANSNLQPAIAPNQQPAKIYTPQSANQHNKCYTDKKAHAKLASP